MELNRRTMAIGGVVLVALLIVASVVFSPSGYLTGGPNKVACFELNKVTKCPGSPATDFWDENDFNNLDECEAAMDENEFRCSHLNLCYCDEI